MGAGATFESYFDFLRRLSGTIQELTDLAQKKTQAVLHDDLEQVNECMRKEQALGLTLRSMDKKRDELLDELGLGGVPLSGLAEHCPAEFRREARDAAKELRSRYDIYRGAAEVSRTTLECNLHQIEKYLKDESGGLPQSGALADIRA